MPIETIDDSPALAERKTLTSTEFTNEQAWIDAGTMRRGQPAPRLFGPLPATERRFTIDWVDSHLESLQPPDPTYPDGCAIDVALDANQACRVELPWPAERRGLWVVVCRKCEYAISLATAGRADDPRSVRVPCKR